MLFAGELAHEVAEAVRVRGSLRPLSKSHKVGN